MQVLSDGRFRRSRSEWQQIVKRSEESDVSEAEFCIQEKIQFNTFTKWKRRLRHPPKAPGAFIEVVQGPAAAQSLPRVVGEFELSLPGGATLRWKA